jgi:hypothetical protein
VLGLAPEPAALLAAVAAARGLGTA